MIIRLVSAIIIFTLCFCKGQVNRNADVEMDGIESESINNSSEADNGIIYFSFDNGNTWRNSGSGIPQRASIGLGGIAGSENLLGVATKEYGVYICNFMDSSWLNIPSEKQIIDGNPGALIIYRNNIYAGTQFKGIFYSGNFGKTWSSLNGGLNNLTIRRILELGNNLYVCTNDGFYSLNKDANGWELQYGYNSLQVNGAAVFKGSFYIATNKGVYKRDSDNYWINVLPEQSVHNISSAKEQLYAMAYRDLLLSSGDGIIWQSAQEGLPENLYTFNVVNHNDLLFAGQWDGVYRKSELSSKWIKSSQGLPANIAVTNLLSFNGILVITTSKRKFKTDTESNKQNLHNPDEANGPSIRHSN